MGQATVLNVAFNSHNKALLTIMISNNVSGFASVSVPVVVLSRFLSLIHLLVPLFS